MSLNQQPPPESTGQSLGYDPKSSKRNSGLFAFFKWFKPSTSRESIDADVPISESSSSGSLNSVHSAGTVASFSFVPPSAYEKCVSEKCIALGPETDTYKARLKQRDKRRENDKNLTLRKKYNLFFNRDTFLKPKPPELDEENTKSLPLMTRATMEIEEDVKVHRRTNSESSKIKKSGAYLHVKGKRKAPQPPAFRDGHSTTSLRRKKRIAPTPPPVTTAEKVINTLQRVNKVETVQASEEIICNDSLKLDHGILKSAKDTDNLKLSPDQNNCLNAANSQTISARSNIVEAPVSPRPWYKRNSSRESLVNNKKEHKYEPIERLPEVPFMRNSILDLTSDEARPEKKKEEKRKSGMSFLTNISELDREASEIIKNKELDKNGFDDIQEMPEFMRPKDTKINTDSWISPKRRSARDLIAKFNAITNVTKVTVNSAFFGASQKDSKLFGKQTSLDETKRRQESLLESHKKRLEEIDKKNAPLMKSESASAIKPKPDTPKLERKSWKCPKCNLENEYWRIICHVCSAIKPYFDDFSSNKSENKHEVKASSPLVIKREKTPPKKPEISMERSKTQIGFSALASYNANNKNKIEKATSIEDKSQVDAESKKIEREKLKKMLIEMKNSLPKRKSNIMMKQNSRTSVIVENPENVEMEIKEKSEEAKGIETDSVAPKTDVSSDNNVSPTEKTQEEKVAEILIGTTQTIYENIKVRKTDNPKPIKVSAEAQTTSGVKQIVPPSTIANIVKEESKKNNYELMRPKDFEDIYADNNEKSAVRIYANLARNDELSLFFNMPKNFNNLKNQINQAQGVNKTDTIEINRLLRRLETSIAKGELTDAAIFAKELAQLKVNCSVIRQKPPVVKAFEKKKGFQIEMYVEDKISHRGPFPIEVTANQTVAELKLQIEKEFEIPTDYQKWILGKELVTNENSTLKDYNITTEGCPVFLYLVAPDPKTKTERTKSPLTDLKTSPSTSKIPTPSNESQTEIPIETQIVKDITKVEEIKSKPTIDNEIEKMKMNVQNLQRQLNESKNNVKKIESQPQKINPSPVKAANGISLEPKKNSIPTIDILPETPSTKSITKISIQPTVALPSKSLMTPVTTQPPVIVDHAPKIINVIPKLAENKPKTEVIIPVVAEEKSSPTRIEKPISVTEIQIEEKQIQSPPKIVIRSSKDSAFTKAPSPSKKDSNIVKVEDAQGPPKEKFIEEKQIQPASKVPIKNSKTQEVAFPKVKNSSENAKPDEIQSTSTATANMDIPVQRPQRKSEVKLAPKAKEEEMDDYDSKTLKPAKEWECHLCTLLNPVSSNICAVCATVRLSKNQPPKRPVKKKAPQPNVADTSTSKDQTYLQLVHLDNADLVENVEAFECVVCFLETPPREGVTLRECLHQFCKACLAHTIEYNEEAEVKCPYRDDDYSCNIALQDREIKALVTPAVYEQHLAKSVAQAENKMDKSFHCKTPDCKGWCVFEDNVNDFRCPVCRKINCLTCQAIHMGVNCKQYQERMKEESTIDEDARRTRAMLNEMVEKGEAIECPTCKVILMKKWGCDWLRCSMCKTEICWVTRGPRWGPAGKGDTSGGCQCGVNGIKCHPKCNYCH